MMDTATQRRTTVAGGVIAALWVALTSSNAYGQSVGWDGEGADNNWSTAANWVFDTPPGNPATPGADSIIGFLGSARLTPNVDQAWSGITEVRFDSSADPFVLGGMSISFLNNASIVNNSTNLQTFDNDLIANGTTLFLTATAGDLLFNGGFDLSDAAGSADGVDLVVNASNDTDIAGVISGADGRVFNTGNGTLTLGGANTYTGATIASNGTIIINGGVAGDVQSLNSATVEINAGVGGDLSVDGASNTVIKNGGTVVSDVSVNRGTLTVEVGGSINGTTGVNGTMVLDGDTLGDVNVQATTVFTRLSGTGTVGGNLTVTNFGSTVAPGNGIGTMDVGGDYTQNVNAELEIEINQNTNSADLLNVTGSATLAANSRVTIIQDDSDTIADGKQFTIVQTGSGVIDEGATTFFSSASNPLIGFALQVVGNNLLITAERGGNFFEGNAGGANNLAIGKGLDTLNATNPTGDPDTLLNTLAGLIDPMDPTDTAALNSAISQLSPQTYNVPAETNIEIARSSNQRTGDYLAARRRGIPTRHTLTRSGPMGPMLASAAPDPQLLAYAMNAPARPPYQGYRSLEDGPGAPGRWGGFAQGFGLFEEKDTQSGLTGFDADAYGVQVGLDYAPFRNVIVGLSFSYINTDVDLNDGRGDSDIDTYRVGPYLSYEAHPWHFAYALTFGVHEADNTRVMPAIPATATSDTDSWDVAFYAEGGVDFQVGEHTYVTPMGSLQFLHFEQDDFVESGGGGAALSVDSRDTNSLRTRLGAGVTHTIKNARSDVVLEGYFGWEHEYMADDGDEMVARFTAGGSPFAINVGSANEDSLFIGGGVSVLMDENVSLYMLYDGNFFSDGETHAIGGGVTLRF